MKKQKVEIELEVVKKVAKPNGGFLPVAGWHTNTADFSGDLSGNITFINGTVTIILNGKNSFGIDLKPLIEKCIELYEEPK